MVTFHQPRVQQFIASGDFSARDHQSMRDAGVKGGDAARTRICRSRAWGRGCIDDAQYI